MKITNLPDLSKQKKNKQTKYVVIKRRRIEREAKRHPWIWFPGFQGFGLFHFFIGLNFAYVKNRKVLKKREIRNQNIKKNLSCENVQNEKKTLKICTTNNAKKKL